MMKKFLMGMPTQYTMIEIIDIIGIGAFIIAGIIFISAVFKEGGSED